MRKILNILLAGVLFTGVQLQAAATAIDQSGALLGIVLDAETEEPVGWTTLYIKEVNRSVTGHGDGTFHFFDIPAGQFTLSSFRVGYLDGSREVEIRPNDTSFVTILLKGSMLSTESIVVESEKEGYISEMQKPDIEISGKKLRQNLAMTIAKTLETEPGIAQRTMGPAPARPVLRGLGGARLLVLEDGSRTGDLSAISSDHAVVIEPMTAERIEVIRGPESIVYGSSTLGGVVNVARGYVPTTLPHRFTGAANLQGESVNSGLASGGSVVFPLGKFAVKADGSLRRANDILTPAGTLQNTSIQTQNFSAGIAYFPSWGYVGTSAGVYNSDYGIPPDPNGGHPKGVDIELSRNNYETRAEIYTGYRFLYRIDLEHSYKHYEHSEFEANGDLGIKFGVLTHNFKTMVHFNRRGSFSHGEIGIWGEFRDYASSGLSFTPPSKETSLAGFFYAEHKLGRFAFNASGRYDYKSVMPSDEKIVERADFSLNIRERNFGDVSGGFSAVYDIGKGFSVGTALMRTFRAPGIEELFSEGPHLAAYAYEVGNSELGKENGLGLEVFFDYKSSSASARLAFYRNDISGYIFPRNTGSPSLRRADLYLYQYTGEHALMTGFEGSWEWYWLTNLIFSGSASYVQGELVDKNEPLPRIPPFEGKTNFRYEYGDLAFNWTSRFAADQDRLGEFESETAGFVVCNISAEYFYSTTTLLHTLTFAIENIGNNEYRQHLNRVKEIMPEPGRNIKLLYKIYF